MTGESIPVVVFRFRARFGHFLKAEASVSALTYPFPPRTAVMGMIGAVLGLDKDTPQVELSDARIAVSGAVPQTHWHRVKLRKDPPAALPLKIKRGSTGQKNPAPEMATLNRQEWLFKPEYELVANLSEANHADFVGRLRERRWHYQPCMGLSEMIADLEFVSEGEAVRLPQQSSVLCESTARRTDGTSIEGRQTIESKTPLAILPLRMPRQVTQERVFNHADYLIERSGRAIPVTSDSAWEIQAGSLQRTVIFL